VELLLKTNEKKILIKDRYAVFYLTVYSMLILMFILLFCKQAELERRRKVLQDAQDRERHERERKEREDFERREKQR
jgi:heme exporter protein D